MNSVFSLFEARLSMRRETLLDGDGPNGTSTIESASMAAIEQICNEPDDEAVLITRIKSQNAD